MTVIKTGFQQDATGSWIAKDPNAQLVYTLDWSEWLSTGDQITAVSYAIQARANDPAPLIKVTEGISGGNKTYVELSGGQVGKIYTVTATVTCQSTDIDRRSFRVKVENRSA